MSCHREADEDGQQEEDQDDGADRRFGQSAEKGSMLGLAFEKFGGRFRGGGTDGKRGKVEGNDAAQAGRGQLEDERHAAELGEIAAIAVAAEHRRRRRRLCVPATLIERAARAAPGFAIGGAGRPSAEKGAHTGCISAAC